MMLKHRQIATLVAPLLLALAACVPASGAKPSSAPAPVSADEQVSEARSDNPVWAFENSDVPLDPAYRFGRLDNGMRYIIRRNTTPQGTGLVRLEVDSGSLAEADHERGFAHFVEHMAFNGSTNVPEGEMIKLLEREGLAFGPDTNASTGFEQTLYMLNLPRNDPKLLETALMLMRETASELTFSEDAVERERGVVLAEKRDRSTYQLRNLEDRLAFSTPHARYIQRLPAGTDETLRNATAQTLKTFWQREYVPANSALIVIGDFDVDTVETAIQMRFADWSPAPMPPEGEAGPVDFTRKGMTEIYLDPALPERVTASRHGPYLDRPDSIKTRQSEILRRIGYAIINRRLERIVRQENAPFRDAGFGTGDVFKVGRTTSLIVDTSDGEWRRGLSALTREYRRAVEFGFSQSEITEQVAKIRTATQDAAASADTRSHGALASQVLQLLRKDYTPATPESVNERFEAFSPTITPANILAALRDDAVALDQPLLRFEGKAAPEGGEDALRTAWDEAIAEKLVKRAETKLGSFAYDDFGAPGTVISDRQATKLGIREIVFANGVRLNLKPTELERERVRVTINLDGGEMLDTQDNPLATSMVASLPSGGLGKHNEDELQSILAGRNVDFSLTSAEETFRMSASTTPRDLELQLKLLAAGISDPGYRPQAEQLYRRNIADYFARKDATPGSALGSTMGGILSDQNPRFSLQSLDAYNALTFEKLRSDIGDRLAHGAIEIALVGDFDEDIAVDLVARTFGALPQREAEFRAYDAARIRPFTADRSSRIIRHSGQSDQAALRLVWPTRDDSDLVDALQLELLERVVKIELTDTLREILGKSYSPSASSKLSRTYRGYGTFLIAASVDVADVDETRVAIAQTIAGLRAQPVDADIFQRARQPMLEAYDNALKSNGGWMALVDRAQSEPDRIDRFLAGKDTLLAITPAQLQAAAAQYLVAGKEVEILALPNP